MPTTRSIPPRKGDGESTCSVTSWVIRGVNTCTSRSLRTSRMTIREHVRRITHLGGVAATCLYDNMKVRGCPVRGRRADLQHPLPGVRHALRVYKWWAWERCCPQTQGKARAKFQVFSDQLPQRPQLPQLAEHLHQCLAQWLADAADWPSSIASLRATNPTCTPRNCPT